MISMLFPTVIENVIKQLPQLDLTFGIGDFVGSIALLVSAFAFYISHTQASQSEQIKTSRDIWAGIVEKYSKYMEARREHSKGKGGPDENELERKARNNFRGWLADVDYFAYLILEGEVKDKVVIGYYRGLLAYNI